MLIVDYAIDSRRSPLRWLTDIGRQNNEKKKPQQLQRQQKQHLTQEFHTVTETCHAFFCVACCALLCSALLCRFRFNNVGQAPSGAIAMPASVTTIIKPQRDDIVFQTLVFYSIYVTCVSLPPYICWTVHMWYVLSGSHRLASSMNCTHIDISADRSNRILVVILFKWQNT